MKTNYAKIKLKKSIEYWSKYYSIFVNLDYDQWFEIYMDKFHRFSETEYFNLNDFYNAINQYFNKDFQVDYTRVNFEV